MCWTQWKIQSRWRKKKRLSSHLSDKQSHMHSSHMQYSDEGDEALKHMQYNVSQLKRSRVLRIQSTSLEPRISPRQQGTNKTICMFRKRQWWMREPIFKPPAISIIMFGVNQFAFFGHCSILHPKDSTQTMMETHRPVSKHEKYSVQNVWGRIKDPTKSHEI